MVKQINKRASVDDTVSVPRVCSSIDKRNRQNAAAEILRGAAARGKGAGRSSVGDAPMTPTGRSPKRTPKGANNKENSYTTPGGTLLSSFGNQLEGLLPFGRAASDAAADAAQPLVDLYQSVVAATEDVTAGPSEPMTETSHENANNNETPRFVKTPRLEGIVSPLHFPLTPQRVVIISVANIRRVYGG